MFKSLSFLRPSTAHQPTMHPAAPVIPWHEAGLCLTCNLVQPLQYERCLKDHTHTLTPLAPLFQLQRRKIEQLRIEVGKQPVRGWNPQVLLGKKKPGAA